MRLSIYLFSTISINIYTYISIPHLSIYVNNFLYLSIYVYVKVCNIHTILFFSDVSIIKFKFSSHVLGTLLLICAFAEVQSGGDDITFIAK